MTTELLRAEHLSGGYGKVACVRDLNLEVRPGEVVVLLGPNGAGKTTTPVSYTHLVNRSPSSPSSL